MNPQQSPAPQNSNSDYGERNGLGAYLGKIGEKVKGNGTSTGQALENFSNDSSIGTPATLLSSPQLNQEALPDTLAQFVR